MRDSVRYENEKWLPLLDHEGRSVNGSGRRIYVREKQQEIFTKIAKAAQTNFHQLYLDRQVRRLQNMGYIRSLINKFRSTDRVFELEGGKLVYAVDGKCNIYLKDILIEGPFHKRDNDLPDDGGVYKVKLNEDKWLADKAGQRGYIDTDNAAINGACEHINEAAGFMPEFIREGYGQNALKSSYNLFYVPTHGMGAEWRGFCDYDNFGAGSQIAQKLADTLELTARRGNATQWTVHEHGHTVLAKALRILETRRVDLSSQTVFFANAFANVHTMKTLCRGTNMQLSETLSLMNPLSLRQTWFSGNFLSETAVSFSQILTYGEKKGRTHHSNVRRLLSRLGLPGAVVAVSSTALGTVAWGALITALAASNLAPKANQKVIKSVDDGITHLRGKLCYAVNWYTGQPQGPFSKKVGMLYHSAFGHGSQLFRTT